MNLLLLKKSKVLKAITFLLLLLFSCNFSYSQSSGWQIVYRGPLISGISGIGVPALHFINANTGYGAFQGGIIKTTNAGINWTVYMCPNLPYFSYRSIHFINENTGFIAAGGSTADSGAVFKTTNAGVNWFQIDVGLTRHFTTVFFINQNTGFVTGHWAILRTTNGGVNWSSQYPAGFVYFFGMCFTSPETGYYVGNAGRICKTTDGGISWNLLNSGTSTNLWNISFADANTGCASGGFGSGTENIILRTTNAGVNWNICYNDPNNNYIWNVKFINSETGFAIGIGNGLLIKTTNRGLNWNNCPISFQFQYGRGIYFTNDMTGYISGMYNDTGFVAKTTTCGTGIEPISTEIPSEFKLNQNYPNPFNPNTIIRYQLPVTNFVTLRVFDILGKEVATLVNEKLQPGTYEVTFDGSNLTSGVYFYKLSAGDFQDTKKMLIIK